MGHTITANQLVTTMIKDIKRALAKHRERIGEEAWEIVMRALDEATTAKDDGFEDAWKAYDKKVGKKPALIAWRRLTTSERSAALTHIPRFVKATPEKKYRPDFRTYVHQRRWEDEELPIAEDAPQPPMTYHEMLIDAQKKGITAGPPKYKAVAQPAGRKPMWLPA